MLIAQRLALDIDKSFRITYNHIVSTKEIQMNYDNEISQMKAISWQLKRIADLMESSNTKPSSMSESFGYKPPVQRTGKTRAVSSANLKKYLSKLGE